MTDCLFCKIIAGIVPSQKLYEDDQIVAFKDIFPKADFHALVVPKKHIDSLAAVTPEDSALLGYLTLKLRDIARQNQITDFRTIVNTGPGGGQEIFHLHYHLLAGKRLPGFK